MTVDPGTSPRSARTTALIVLGLAILACLAFAPLLESRVSCVRDFSASGPVMGCWKLVDDGGLRAHGVGVPESLVFETFLPRPGEVAPLDVLPEQLARMSSGSREVLLVNHGLWFEYVLGSGVSPFADSGPTDGVALLLGLHDHFGGWLDRLYVGLGPDGLNGSRLRYARD